MSKQIIVKCSKCGKVAPINYDKSTAKFIIYKTDEPCKCGGKWETRYE